MAGEFVASSDETHVVHLTTANFSSFLAARRHVLVLFYEPWFTLPKMLATNYAAAASHLALENVDVGLAIVDATEDSDLAQTYDVQRFPTLLFFVDGVHKNYSGGYQRGDIVAWITCMLGMFSMPAYIRALEGSSSDDPSSSDETNVVFLTAANFSSFLAARRHVLILFYKPWCEQCRTLALNYAAAASHLALENVDVALAMVDATEESDLAQTYDAQFVPTRRFFIDGVHKDYSCGQSRDAIVDWITNKLGHGAQNVTTVDDAERIVSGDDTVVLAFLDSLSGAHSDELAAASRLEDTLNFYQTASSDVAKLFHIDPEAKRPPVVLLSKEHESLTVYDGEFRASAIAKFVSANKLLPLIPTLTEENKDAIFDSPIKKMILLFAVANKAPKFLPIFKKAAKPFKGKLLFVFVERNSMVVGGHLAYKLGVTGQETTVLAYTGNEDAKKFLLGGEISVDNIKEFAQDFLENKLTPFYKSDPVPKSNDKDVKVVVGKNLDQIVLDESKDVLLEIYKLCSDYWTLKPTYNKLAKHLRGIDSLVIAEMDGTDNEHPRAKPDGFPTILFYPAGKKIFEPITFEGDQTVGEMYEFIKKHASIPFKLKRPDSSAARTESS